MGQNKIGDGDRKTRQPEDKKNLKTHPVPVADNTTFWIGKSYLYPLKFSAMGNPLPMTVDISTVAPALDVTRGFVESFSLMRNSREPLLPMVVREMIDNMVMVIGGTKRTKRHEHRGEGGGGEE